MKQKTLFVYRNNHLEEILKHLDSPDYPKDFLYGMNHLGPGFFVHWINVRRGGRNTFWRKLSFFIEKPFCLITKLGLPLEIYAEFRKELEGNDRIICVNDPISFGVLFWKMLGLIRGRVFVLIMSLPERLKYFRHNILIIWFFRLLLARADRILTLSEIAQGPLNATFRVPRDKMKTFLFGVDVKFWKGALEVRRRDFILAVGNDFNRDYQTLIRAIPEHLKLVLVTNKPLNLQKKKKIKVLSGISDQELRHLYRACYLVVIPSLGVRNESSGLSCTLQAMACGAAVLISDAPPLREYFQENKHIFFYQPENTLDLRKKILELYQNRRSLNLVGREARKLVLEKFTTQDMQQTWLNIFKI